MKKRILCVITAGSGGQDEYRARLLTAQLDASVEFHAVEKSKSRRTSSQSILAKLKAQPWDLVYQEGTGIAGGAVLISQSRNLGIRYIVSSGDPVSGFFRATKGPIHGKLFEAYERLLYRNSSGFIGWTPYLTGRAIEMGARRAMTVEGGADLNLFRELTKEERLASRQRFGLNPSHLVCGVAGSLNWRPRQSYSYGLELIEMLKLVKRTDVSILIVGDGDGRAQLERRVPQNLEKRVVFTGRLQPADVVLSMNAMDIGFITQTMDTLGSFRLTTKLPEYLACGLPIAMSPIPGFYDYVSAAGWALPALHPANPEFHSKCAAWVDDLQWNDHASKAAHARAIACQRFDYEKLANRFARFVNEIFSSSTRT